MFGSLARAESLNRRHQTNPISRKRRSQCFGTNSIPIWPHIPIFSPLFPCQDHPSLLAFKNYEEDPSLCWGFSAFQARQLIPNECFIYKPFEMNSLHPQHRAK